MLLICKPYLLTIILQSTKRFVSEKHVGLQLFVMEKISKYNYKFHDMKAKFDWYTILSLEKISGPVKPQKNLIAIELIAKCFFSQSICCCDQVVGRAHDDEGEVSPEHTDDVERQSLSPSKRDRV